MGLSLCNSLPPVFAGPRMAQRLRVDVRRQTGARGVDGGTVAGAASQVEIADGQVARITTARRAAHAYAGVGVCSATGRCYPGDLPVCNLYLAGCACDGTAVNTACTGLPTDVYAKPLSHAGACKDGG